MDTDCSGGSVTRLGRAARLLSMVLVCAHFSPGLRAAPLPARPNIIVILMDDLRWDEMDYPFVSVPSIRRLASELRLQPGQGEIDACRCPGKVEGLANLLH